MCPPGRRIFQCGHWLRQLVCATTDLTSRDLCLRQAACEWFLDHMASDDWWPIQILIKCPNQMVRQMFQRLCIHVVQKLRSVAGHLTTIYSV